MSNSGAQMSSTPAASIRRTAACSRTAGSTERTGSTANAHLSSTLIIASFLKALSAPA
jgi:hypothetical protein